MQQWDTINLGKQRIQIVDDLEKGWGLSAEKRLFFGGGKANLLFQKKNFANIRI